MRFHFASTLLLFVALLAAACGPSLLPQPAASPMAPAASPALTSVRASAPTTPAAVTIAVTAAPTLVPPGVFALIVFYTPLILNYDPALWTDASRYSDLSVWVNQLRARGFDTCTLGPEGPNGNFPAPDKIVRLGQIQYQVTVVNDQTPGPVIAYYIDTNSLPQFDYQTKGVVKLDVVAKSSEWDRCQHLAETVLGTLHWPD